MTAQEPPEIDTSPEHEPEPKRYRAFISYSHADNSAQGRKWADWLHHSLETYQIPAELIGKPNAHGQPIPAQIYPVFQDEKELSANSNLSASLTQALDRSDFLVFLASPRSARSVYVQEELRHFKQQGKSSRIIALILRGEPEYGGADSDDQCFPQVLRHAVDAEGRIIEAQTEEALAADVRLPHSREEGFTSSEAYRQHLQAQKLPAGEIKQRVQEYEARLNLAKLKIISTILGVPLADLTKRDQAYQLERLRRKNRITAIVAAGMGGLAVAAAFAGVAAWQQKTRAQQNFALTLYTSGLNKLAQNEYGDPAAYIAAAVRGGNANATAFAESMLATKEELTLLPNMSAADLAFSPDGRYLAGRARMGANAQRMQIWDVRSRSKVADVEGAELARSYGRAQFDAKNRLYFVDDKYRVLRYDLATKKLDVLFANEGATALSLMAVSPDGQWLGLRRTGGELLVRGSDQKEKDAKATLPATMNQVTQLNFAQDSSATSLCAEREGRKLECLIVPLSGEDAPEPSRVMLEGTSRKVSFAEGGRKALFWTGTQLDVWDGGDARPLPTDGRVYQWVAFNPGAQTILAVGDSSADVFRMPNGEREESHALPLGALKSLFPQQSSGDDKSPDFAHAIVTRNSRVFLQQLGPTPQLAGQIAFAADTRRIAADADGKYLFSLRKDGSFIARTDLATHKVQTDFIRESAPITHLNVLRSGVVATTSAQYQTRFYDVQSGKALGDPVQSRSLQMFSGDEKMMVARIDAQTLGVWQVADGKQVMQWKPAEGDLPPFALDPVFKRIIHVDDKGWRLLDMSTRKVLLEGDKTPGLAQLTPDGSVLAIGDKEGRITVWSVADARKVAELQSITTPLLRFSPDGRTMVVSEDARRLRLWNLETGQPVGQVIPVISGARWGEFSADGQRFFVQDNVGDSLLPAVKVIDSHNGNLISMPFARGMVRELMLVKGEQQLVTVTTDLDGTQALVWQVPGTMRQSPEQLAGDLESFYGRKYDVETGAIQPYNGAGKFSSWFFADPYTRPVEPGSTTSVQADIERQLPIKDGAQMQTLAATYLFHPLARAGIAEFLSRQGKLGALALQVAGSTEQQLANVPRGPEQAASAASDSKISSQASTWLTRTREQLGLVRQGQ